MSEPAAEKAKAIQAARDMTAALRDVWTQLKTLNAYTHRTRHIVWAVIISLAFDFAITGWVYEVAHTAGQANARSAVTQAYARGVHAAQITACQAGNARLAKQQTALDAILTLGSAPPHATIEQRREAAAFRRKAFAEVSHGWAPRDCRHLYHLGPARPAAGR